MMPRSIQIFAYSVTIAVLIALDIWAMTVIISWQPFAKRYENSSIETEAPAAVAPIGGTDASQTVSAAPAAGPAQQPAEDSAVTTEVSNPTVAPEAEPGAEKMSDGVTMVASASPEAASPPVASALQSEKEPAQPGTGPSNPSEPAERVSAVVPTREADPPAVIPVPEPVRAPPRISQEEADAPVMRGDALFMTGDVTSARLFYECGAVGGSGVAALRLGATFDPAFLAKAGWGQVPSDLGKARYWYRRASELGNSDAGILLNSMGNAGE